MRTTSKPFSASSPPKKLPIAPGFDKYILVALLFRALILRDNRELYKKNAKKFSKGICNFLTSSQNGNLCGLIVAFHVGLNSVSERFLVPYLRYLAKCNTSWDRLLVFKVGEEVVQGVVLGFGGVPFYEHLYLCGCCRPPLCGGTLEDIVVAHKTKKRNSSDITGKKYAEKMLMIIVRSSVK